MSMAPKIPPKNREATMPVEMLHWIVAPVVLPLLTGAMLVLVERRAPAYAPAISLIAVLLQLLIAGRLLAQAIDGEVGVYLLGNWAAPFGIALALDRLSAMMLMLTALVALAAVLYARDGDQRRGAHFHALLQFQLMGLNGAFLTADLFNLFVFFEVLLIASYGLLLHGVGQARLRAAIHYVTFNLAGSALFLVAVAMLFGLTGTLNMADLAERVTALDATDAVMVRSAALLLLVVFCVKAALLPLYFWLPDTYGAATAPVAALFAIMTKVGVYAIARVYTLVFGAGGGVAADVAYPWLPAFAIATLALAAIGALAAYRLRMLVAYVVISSAGTLLLAIGVGTVASVAAGLFYLVNSTLIAAALFLLVDRIAMRRGDLHDQLRPAPVAVAEGAVLGALYLVFAMTAAGLPPLAGFIGKGLVLDAVRATPLAPIAWAAILLSSLGMIIALARAGTTLFWAGGLTAAPASRAGGRAAIAVLLVVLIANAIFAGPLAAYARATSEQLAARRPYIDAVLGAQPMVPLWNPRQGLIK
jgi:multicomponent K+:H+ antiporter subunit D